MIGVAVATVQGAAMNLAIPVGPPVRVPDGSRIGF